MASGDVYDDLEGSCDLGALVQKLQARNKLLENHVVSLEEDIKKLCDRIVEMRNTQENLSKNISSLYKTAKAELERKDRTIAELRSQVDDFTFRRGQRWPSAPKNGALKPEVNNKEQKRRENALVHENINKNGYNDKSLRKNADFSTKSDTKKRSSSREGDNFPRKRYDDKKNNKNAKSHDERPKYENYGQYKRRRSNSREKNDRNRSRERKIDLRAELESRRQHRNGHKTEKTPNRDLKELNDSYFYKKNLKEQLLQQEKKEIHLNNNKERSLSPEISQQLLVDKENFKLEKSPIPMPKEPQFNVEKFIETQNNKNTKMRRIKPIPNLNCNRKIKSDKITTNIDPKIDKKHQTELTNQTKNQNTDFIHQKTDLSDQKTETEHNKTDLTTQNTDVNLKKQQVSPKITKISPEDVLKKTETGTKITLQDYKQKRKKVPLIRVDNDTKFKKSALYVLSNVSKNMHLKPMSEKQSKIEKKLSSLFDTPEKCQNTENSAQKHENNSTELKNYVTDSLLGAKTSDLSLLGLHLTHDGEIPILNIASNDLTTFKTLNNTKNTSEINKNTQQTNINIKNQDGDAKTADPNPAAILKTTDKLADVSFSSDVSEFQIFKSNLVTFESSSSLQAELGKTNEIASLVTTTELEKASLATQFTTESLAKHQASLATTIESVVTHKASLATPIEAVVTHKASLATPIESVVTHKASLATTPASLETDHRISDNQGNSDLFNISHEIKEFNKTDYPNLVVSNVANASIMVGSPLKLNVSGGEANSSATILPNRGRKRKRCVISFKN